MVAKETRKERDRSTAARLAQLLPSAVRDIRRKILRRRFHPQAPALEIELHFDGRRSRFVAYEMDGRGNQFTSVRNGKTSFGGVYPVLSRALTFPGVEFNELEAPLARWFRDAWARAGGVRFPLRTTFRVHDDIKEVVLAKGSARPAPPPPGRRWRLEFIRGTSRKFWEIVLSGTSFTITSGRIGTAGRSMSKSYTLPNAANVECAYRRAAKQREGYRLVAESEARVASAPANVVAIRPRRAVG
jgi:predicted DNA-binding WGR domain protein